MKKVILLAFSFIFLTSCEKEIEFNGEHTAPRLVINSLIEAGQPVSARIGKSIFFLDNDNDMQCPDDMVATLTVNGNLYGIMNPVACDVLLHVRQKGIFKATIAPFQATSSRLRPQPKVSKTWKALQVHCPQP